ncbi:hypothetical protein [Massilia sp. CF038]|uniref:hypothetical protein n=1 Tax=Massilia sp. CF038 TaxID=1881045 RepID=UPI000911484C|nr:hypothetical protein [Massilia sp. CF038]SHG55621.1 hypothetical protein SAMN05428948_1011 [Massilia sp. CF038]
MLNKLSPALLCATLALAGCATQTPAGGEESGTTLDVFVHNDVPGAATMKISLVNAYADATTCAKSVSIARKGFMKDQDQHSTIKIPAGKPFTASVATSWTRFGAGGNDYCSVTATFTPQANTSYRALLKLNNGANSCQLQIADQNNREVPFQAPAYSCDQSMGTAKNGAVGFRSVTPTGLIIFVPR